MLDIYAEADEKVEAAEREVRLPDDCVCAEAAELIVELGIIDDHVVAGDAVVAEARLVFDDSVPEVAAREVMIKLSSRAQSCRLCIIEGRSV